MKTKLALIVCGLTLILLPRPGLAQTEALAPLPTPPTVPQLTAAPGEEPTTEGETVDGRPRPELDPLGVHFGNFFFYPRLEYDGSFNDNVYGTPSHRIGDYISRTAPSFDLLSSTPEGGINVHAGGALGQYASNSNLNYNDGYGAFDSYLNLTELNHLTGGLRIEQAHEDPSSPNFPGNAREPVVYHNYVANIGDNQTGSIIGYRLNASVTRQEYEAVPAAGGGLISQSPRDVTITDGLGEINYELVPGNQIYLRSEGNYRNYDHAAGNGIPTRTSSGMKTDLGGRVNLTGLLSVDGYIGYIEQDYEAPSLGVISGLDFGGHATWNVTTLDTIRLGVERSVQDVDAELATTVAQAYAFSPGYLHTTATLGIDHELRRNLLVSASVGYANDAYQGISRNDVDLSGTVGAKYLLNRNLYLGATFSVLSRNSSGTQAGFSFTQDIFLVRLSTQF